MLGRMVAFLATLGALIGVLIGYSHQRYGNLTFGHQNQYTNPKWWLQKLKPDLILSEAELAKYDGTNGKPILLAVDGDVYDVSATPELYGTGKPYSFFVGKDGARAYVTGCFATDLTHDLRGIEPERLLEIDAWKLFYNTHAKYYRVGKVVHPPIPDDVPVPPPCDAAKMPN
ncbi:hypothetical protein PYCC9005_004422 [Savitreella phatthalungensis]